MMKKLLSILLSVVMALSLTMPAFAVTGEGTPEDPLIIESVNELMDAVVIEEIEAVRLGADIDVRDTHLPLSHSLTLDLAGKRLYNGSHENVTFDFTNPGCTLTITDSSPARESQIDNLYVNGVVPDCRVNLNGGTYWSNIGFSGQIAVRIGDGCYPNSWNVDPSCDVAVTGGCFMDEQVSRYCAEGYTVGENPLADLDPTYPFAVSAAVLPDNTFDLKTGFNTFRMAPGEENAVTVTFTPEESGRYSFASACEVYYDPCATVDGKTYNDVGTDLNFSFDRVLTAGEPFTFSVQQQTEGRECLFRLDVEQTSAAFVPVTFDLQGKGDNVTVEVETGTSAWVARRQAFPKEDPSWDGYRLATFSPTPIEGEPTADQLAALREAFNGEAVTGAVTYYAVWVEIKTVDVTFDLQGHGENVTVEVEEGEYASEAAQKAFSGSDPTAENVRFVCYSLTPFSGDLTYDQYEQMRYEFSNAVISADTATIYVVWRTDVPTALTLGDNAVTVPGGSDFPVTVTFTPAADGLYRFTSTNADCDPVAFVGDEAYDDNAGNSNFSFLYSLQGGVPFSFSVAAYGNSFESQTVMLNVAEITPVSLTLGDNTIEVENYGSGNAVPVAFTPAADGFYQFTSTNEQGDPGAFVDGQEYDDEIGRDFTFTRELTAGVPFYFTVCLHENDDNVHTVLLTVAETEDLTHTTVTLGDNTFATPGNGSDNAVTVTFTPDADGWYQFTSTNEDGDPCAKVDGERYDDNDGGYNFTFKRELTANEPFSFTVYVYNGSLVSLRVAETEAPVMVPVTFDLQGKGDNVTVEVEKGAYMWEAISKAFPFDLPAVPNAVYVGFSLSSMEDDPSEEAIAAARNEVNSSTVQEPTVVYVVWKTAETVPVTIDLQGRGDPVITYVASGDYLVNAVWRAFPSDPPSAENAEFACYSLSAMKDDPTQEQIDNVSTELYCVVTEPVTVYVVWKTAAAPAGSVNVTIDMGGVRDDIVVPANPGDPIGDVVSSVFPGEFPTEETQALAGFTLQPKDAYDDWDAYGRAADELWSTAVGNQDVTVYAGWFEKITPEFTVKAPVCGAQGYFNAPEVTLPEDAHYSFTNTLIPIVINGSFMGTEEGDPTYWKVSEETVFTAGVQYQGVAALEADYGYYPSDDAVVNGADDVNVVCRASTAEYNFIITAAHDYQFDSFVWGESGDTAQAKLVCAVHPDQAIYEDAAITEEFHPATSPDETPYTVYTAIYGEYTDQNTVLKPDGLRVIAQPSDSAAAYGKPATATFSVTGEGVTYKWFLRNAGGTEFAPSSLSKATYSVVMNAQRSGREVYCVAKDAYGNTVQSDTVTLTMEVPDAYALTVDAQPADLSVAYGQQATATFAVEGDGLTYQWYLRNAGGTEFAPSSLTGSTYSVKMTPERSGRQVYCVVTDAYGNTYTSETVTLTMAAPAGYALTVVSQPADCKVANRKTATSVFAVEGEGLTYQWYGRDPGQTDFWKSGHTTERYAVKMESAKSGRQVYCVVTDVYGNTVTSETATLTMK